MFLSFFCACQIAATSPPPLVVRVGDRVQSVPVLAHPEGGSAVRGTALAAALGGKLVDAGGGRWRLELGDARLSFDVLAPFALSGDEALPMPASPFRSGGELYLPFALATDVLPRAWSGLMFDGARMELRRFAPVTRSTTVARAGSSAPPAERAVSDRVLPTPGATRPVAEPVSRPVPPPLASGGGVTPASRPPVRRRTVVVDAGHGGRDPGTTLNTGTTTVPEKVVALAVALKLRDALQERGVTVVMTRTRDTLINLYDRGPIANKAKGDLFVSIHTNAANEKARNRTSIRGFETYFLAEAKTEDDARVAAMENEVVKFETSEETSRSDPLGFILRDMAQNEHLRESLTLASIAQKALAAVHPGPNRGVKQAPFNVLVKSFMPSMLVELGYGSNPVEARYLLSEAGQRELANAIADACVEFLAAYERKISGEP